MPRLLAFLTFLITAGMGQAGPGGVPDGTFDATSCANASDGRVVLRGNELSFHESFCALSNPQGLRGLTGPVLVDASCSGEGETWQTRFILSAASDGGLAIISDGSAMFYARCN